jgi:hypothetical protein
VLLPPFPTALAFFFELLFFWVGTEDELPVPRLSVSRLPLFAGVLADYSLLLLLVAASSPLDYSSSR